MSREGILFVASGPSGSGKTTLCRRVEERLYIPHSISCTTRPARSTEQNGKDYYFIKDIQFDEMIEQDKFIEWANVHGFRYGTPRATIQEARNKGQDLILDVDTQGALAIKKADSSAVLVFIDTPDDKVLAERLGKRGTEDDSRIRSRLAQAERERLSKSEYHYIIVNDNLEKAYQALVSLIEKERVKRC